MELPKQADKMNGWDIDYHFLREVKDAIHSKTKERITLEAVEDVLMAVERVMKKRKNDD